MAIAIAGSEGGIAMYLVAMKQAVHLTKREKEIMLMAEKGMTARQIGVALFISHETVRKHLVNVYRKLRVNGKMEAVHKIRGE